MAVKHGMRSAPAMVEVGDRFSFANHNSGWVWGARDIYLTVDGGNTWTAHSIGVNQLTQSFSFIDTQQGWIIGSLSWDIDCVRRMAA
ncbi:MAG: hypothetical protein R2759_17995 [Bacteroidales bacterium]